MNWFKIIWRIFKHQKHNMMDKFRIHPKQFKESKASKQKMTWNIDGATERGEYVSRFEMFHFKFKHKILYPLTLILEKIYGNILDVKIPDEPYNKNIKIFDEAYEHSLKIWHDKFMSRMNMNKKYDAESFKNSSSIKNLRLGKKVAMSFYRNDTVYREFMNILMHSITRLMMKEYDGKTVEHLFYSSKKIYDLHWLSMFQVAQNNFDVVGERDELVEVPEENKKKTKEKILKVPIENK